jgi:hypothetical protein
MTAAIAAPDLDNRPARLVVDGAGLLLGWVPLLRVRPRNQLAGRVGHPVETCRGASTKPKITNTLAAHVPPLVDAISDSAPTTHPKGKPGPEKSSEK